MKISLLHIILLLFFQCKSKSEVIQENQKTETTETKEIFEKKETLTNQLIDDKNPCKEICFSFPKTINKDSLIKKIPLKIIIENNTENVVIAGEKYKIEKFKNGKWSKIEFVGVISDVGYKINPKSKIQIEIPTFYLHNLSKGNYKIYQDVMIMPNKSKYNLVKEFYVIE